MLLSRHTRRREFITLLGAAAAWPLAARAQQPQRLRRVGLLIAFPKDLEFQGLVKAFKQTLDAQGWVDGKNVHFDERWAEAGANRIPSFAADIVGATPDVILASSTPALVALRQQTRTIPLVCKRVRPGRRRLCRFHGAFTSFEYSIGGKWLELLKEATPSLRRVLVVLNQENYTSRALLHTITALAPSIGVQLSTGRVRSSAEIKATIETFGQLSNGAVIILPDPLMTADRERIAALAISHRLPTIHPFRFFAAGGCLMSYGTDNLDLYRRAAFYVDRILKGADAAEMPVQNPTKYSLAINLKTAKALGIEVPPTLLARADEVIE